MDWTKVHVGNINQRTGEVNERLKAPVIENPADEPQNNLHGDVEGSPYSRNPGEVGLEEAADIDAANNAAPKGKAKK